MQAFVYKSQRKEDTYVYLAQRDGFEVLPAALAKSLGTLLPVMELSLDQRSRLGRADIAQVREELASRGFYLQVPPSVVSLLPPR